ncbi:hypothetical protein PUNSTDRAFT_124699 [Punctularia strigosozonata HHB-11173 SS5]|uniref:uncharacterized protein n=1 Tax=Punctularia strigosozonata (strain HHB-11173) TaxID=741275 RepID=UPI00044174F7|nr:uncharacterized protein PUNSTDRAFT_124699 [Punctularia strigosozonata HHB-11173 SS5]EIN11251.1 hypothetical protein PUNSTDRAFT_124699 [Punctularia strigosozonata HHB-11173 SS5]
MDSKKRKREADPALVVFNVPDRPGFARLLVEGKLQSLCFLFVYETLEQLKMVVRKKLGVEKHASVKLEWLRDGRAIALSDKDDMSAFHVFAKSTPSVDVNVSLHAEEMPPPPVPVSASARHRTKEPVPDPSNSFAKDLARTINSSLQRDDAGPKPKKRKTSLGPVQGKASVEAPQARPRLVPHDVESRESSVIPDEMISYALALVNPASSSSEPAFKPKKPKKLASNESKESILARSAESRRGGTAPSSAAKFVGDDGTNGVPVNNKKAAKKDKKAKLSPAGQDSDSRRNVSESLTSALAGPSRSAAGFLPSAESDKQDAEGKKKALSKDGHLDNISATLTETSKHKKRRRKRTSSVAPTPDRETAPAVIPAFASVPTAPPANDTPQANTLTRKDKTEQKRQKKERKLRQPTLPLDAPARVATTPTDDAAPPSSTGNKRNIERATLREGAPASSESRKRRKVDANIERDDGSCEGAAVHRGKKKQIGDATIVPSTPQIDLVEAINAANRSPYLPAALPAGSAHIGVENKPKDKEGHTVRSQDSDFADDARKATDAAPPFKAQTQTSSQTVKANPIQPQKPPTLQEKVEKVKEQRHSTQEDRRISTGSSTSDEHDLPSISAAASTASSRAPTIPSRLKIQEVAVETQDEGSSNESSDDDEPTVGVIERSRAPILDDDEDPALRAIIRGPGLHVDHSVLDDLPSDDEEGNEDDEDGLLEDAGVHSDEEDEDPKLARTATRYPGTRMTSVAPSEESSADSEQITGHVKHFVPTVVVDSARNHAPGEPVDAEMADAILEKPASEPVVNSIADANSSSPLAGVSAAEPAVPSFGAIGASSDDTFHPAPSSRAQTVEDSESGRPDKHSRFIEKNLEDTLNGTITARKPAVRGKPGPTSPTSSPAPAAPQASEIVPQTSPSQSREGTPPAWAGILVPGSDSPRSSHQNVEDLLDPIEPSEDLFDANVDDKVDPIESAPTQPQVQLSSPPRTPKHGTSKRMKDRHGNASQKSDTPGLTTLSELQSKLSDAMAATTSPKNGMRPLSSLPPPVLLPAVKRARGRPPLSEEVKAARAAEREKVKAEKAAKAAAAKEQKMAKAAAAKAEKAAKAKEKAAREAKKTRSKSRGASVTPESEDVEHSGISPDAKPNAIAVDSAFLGRPMGHARRGGDRRGDATRGSVDDRPARD